MLPGKRMVVDELAQESVGLLAPLEDETPTCRHPGAILINPTQWYPIGWWENTEQKSSLRVGQRNIW